jgi:glycolate oxidase
MPTTTTDPASPRAAAPQQTLDPTTLRALIAIVGPDAVVAHPDELVVYECDGFTIPKAKPLAVVFPKTTEQVSRLITTIRDAGLAVMPRGTGTGLTGGIVAVTPGIQISLARMNRILEIDLRNRFALVEAGVINGTLNSALAHTPYHYAPDPSSQKASSIGGNVATNAGGLHTLKYGVTVNHILGLEVVTDDGQIHTLGGPEGTGTGHTPGPDLAGLLCGTEGTLAIVTKIWCKLTPKPIAFRTALVIFESGDATIQACQSVSDIIAAGIIPAALEMMDGAMIDIVENAFHLGLPRSAKALLVIEVDGQLLGLDDDMTRHPIHLPTKRRHQIRILRRPRTPRPTLDRPPPRLRRHRPRLSLLLHAGRLRPPLQTPPGHRQDQRNLRESHGLRITNVFHAGDGNVHPALMYDENNPETVQRALAASHDILEYCASIGGAITGEHGVGIEKLPFLQCMFSEADLHGMHQIRHALAPTDTLNPFKTLPREGITINLLHPQRQAPH